MTPTHLRILLAAVAVGAWAVGVLSMGRMFGALTLVTLLPYGMILLESIVEGIFEALGSWAKR